MARPRDLLCKTNILTMVMLCFSDGAVQEMHQEGTAVEHHNDGETGRPPQQEQSEVGAVLHPKTGHCLEQAESND